MTVVGKQDRSLDCVNISDHRLPARVISERRLLLSTAMNDTVAFPNLCIPELIEQIIGNLSPTSLETAKCLWKCGRVSRIFRYMARKISFRSVMIHTTSDLSSFLLYLAINRHDAAFFRLYSVLEFRDMLKKDPAVVNFVQHLQFCVPEVQDLSQNRLLICAEALDQLSSLQRVELEFWSYDLEDYVANFDPLSSLMSSLTTPMHHLRWNFGSEILCAKLLRQSRFGISSNSLWNVTHLCIGAEYRPSQDHVPDPPSFEDIQYAIMATKRSVRKLELDMVLWKKCCVLFYLFMAVVFLIIWQLKAPVLRSLWTLISLFPTSAPSDSMIRSES
jgi:uncharacterized MAPEG superfamily protein